MKKKVIYIMMLFIFCMVLAGCEGNTTDSQETSIEQTESMGTGASQSEQATDEQNIDNVDISLPDGFAQTSDLELQNIPDNDGFINAQSEAVSSIGITEIQKVVYGNYEKIGDVLITIDAYVVTDRNLIIKNQYLNNKWNIAYIKDADNGNLYYPITAQNAYDYITGECINPQEETEEPEKTEEVEETPHREGMYGVSDKNVFDIGGPTLFDRNDVNNDVTGNWRISVINENIQMVDYALSYYNKLMYDDKKIDGIVNFKYNTTTCIQYLSGCIFVTVHEYVDGEEHDAKLLFSGMVLEEYKVYTDNGDIEEIQ